MNVLKLINSDAPRKRLDEVYNLCKSKTMCEGGEEIEKELLIDDTGSELRSRAIKRFA